ncbi:MAG: hypothetical protein AAF825_14425 [Pseudomonadota bacterium]
MTALADYQRLECSALWRPSAGVQRREVMVSLGEATLVISGFNETALSHWSLPAIQRLNPGERPALFALDDADADEHLEISEPDMIAAIDRVRGAISRARPHPGRLRLGLRASGALCLLAAAAFWLPGALARQTAALLPEQSTREIGAAILAEMEALSGPACSSPSGAQALERLAERIFGAEPPTIVVLPEMVSGTSHLPGGVLVLDRAIVETPERPDAVAGYLVAEAARAERQDPLADILEESGIGALFGLLTMGQMPEEAVRSAAAERLTTTPEAVPDAALIAQFTEAQISSAPYGFAVDISGESTLGLIEADPVRGQSPAPVLSERDWRALQTICTSRG